MSLKKMDVMHYIISRGPKNSGTKITGYIIGPSDMYFNRTIDKVIKKELPMFNKYGAEIFQFYHEKMEEALLSYNADEYLGEFSKNTKGYPEPIRLGLCVIKGNSLTLKTYPLDSNIIIVKSELTDFVNTDTVTHPFSLSQKMDDLKCQRIYTSIELLNGYAKVKQ
jgi:hypothetical protein